MPIPVGSTLAVEKAEQDQGHGYIELSGTSFAAPVISGIAAQILAREPELDAGSGQGCVMRRLAAVPEAAPMSCGVGQVNAVQSALLDRRRPNPNAA